MSLNVSTGYTDTAIGGNPTLNMLRASVNFAADFRVKTNVPGEVRLVNITSPLDRPEEVRIALSNVDDIYKGSKIDPANQNGTHKGLSLVVQLTDVYQVTSTTDATMAVNLPVSAHVVFKLPAHEVITGAVMETLFKRLASCLYGTGLTTDARYTALSRGVLKPSDV